MDNQIITQEFIEDNLTKYGLNYHVGTHQEKNPFTDEYIGSYLTYRTDTLEVLKTGFSSRYMPIQNRDAFSVIANIQEVNSNVSIKTMGHMKGKPFAKLKFGEMNIGEKKRGDILNKYVYFINSFDGTSSLKFQIFIERLVCMNGLVSSTNTDTWAFSHTTNASGKVAGLVNTLKIIDGSFVKSEETFNLLSEKTIDSKLVDDLLNELFPVDEEKKRLTTISTKSQEKIKEYISNADNGFIRKDSAWNLYNGITRYITHDKANKKGEVNEHSLVSGALHNENKIALNLIMEAVGI